MYKDYKYPIKIPEGFKKNLRKTMDLGLMYLDRQEVGRGV